jgi:hypothetical protein
MSKDRLYVLSGIRLMRRTNVFLSPDDVLTATSERLGVLHRHRAEVVRLVRQGDPDVLHALFVPQEELAWMVAGISSDPSARLLSIYRARRGCSHWSTAPMTATMENGEPGGH